jgi:uncharacterized protein (DUF1684 family)
MTDRSVAASVALLDWRRRIAELYAEIRSAADPCTAWDHWRDVRARMFAEHPESPVPAPEREGYSGPHLYDYDPAWRALASVEPAEPQEFELPTSNGAAMSFTRFARAHFTAGEAELSLDLYWLDGYAGGLFVPFADRTSGSETYGAGRYALDTIKGSDLGQQDGQLVLDFNFAYQPSCAYDPSWSCPLAPPANRLAVPVRAGERVEAG